MDDCFTYLLPGVPGVKPDRFEEGLEVKHCALSLVGEPIMYPEINTFVRLLHTHNISSFLVTNAQFPQEIRYRCTYILCFFVSLHWFTVLCFYFSFVFFFHFTFYFILFNKAKI